MIHVPLSLSPSLVPRALSSAVLRPRIARRVRVVVPALALVVPAPRDRVPPAPVPVVPTLLVTAATLGVAPPFHRRRPVPPAPAVSSVAV